MQYRSSARAKTGWSSGSASSTIICDGTCAARGRPWSRKQASTLLCERIIVGDTAYRQRRVGGRIASMKRGWLESDIKRAARLCSHCYTEKPWDSSAREFCHAIPSLHFTPLVEIMDVVPLWALHTQTTQVCTMQLSELSGIVQWPSDSPLSSQCLTESLTRRVRSRAEKFELLVRIPQWQGRSAGTNSQEERATEEH